MQYTKVRIKRSADTMQKKTYIVPGFKRIFTVRGRYSLIVPAVVGDAWVSADSDMEVYRRF